MPFWQFFGEGWDGRALLVQPSKMHHRIWKILFVLGVDEYLERLEGKIRKCLFFYVKIFKNNSVIRYLKSCENLFRFLFQKAQVLCTLKNSHHYLFLCREPPSITEQLVVKCHGVRRSSSIQMLMDGTSAPFHTYHPAFLLVSFQQSTRAAAAP